MPLRGLTALVATAEPQRLHAALSLAAAVAAGGGRARVYLHADAVALLADLRSPRDVTHTAAGLPTLAQLRHEAEALGVEIIACQSGLALAGLGAGGIVTSGLIELVATLEDDRLVAF